MHIKREDGFMVMSELIVCRNYSDMGHFVNDFLRMDENKYMCNTCGAVMEIREPCIVQDDKGRLKMQVRIK